MKRLDFNKSEIKKKKQIPFDFVLDLLSGMNIRLQPMFGCYAIYSGDKMLLILRDKESHRRDNGVWLATSHEHHDSLREIFPNMRTVHLLGSKTTAWQNLPAEADDFESAVEKVCEMVRRRDPRIGKVPKKKRAPTKKTKKTASRARRPK